MDAAPIVATGAIPSTPTEYQVTAAIGDAIKEFITDMRLNGRANWTLKKHTHELNRYALWLEQEGLNWQEVRARQLKAFTRQKAEKGYSCKSNMLCSLRVFYAWAVGEDYLDESPAAHFKTPAKPDPLPKALTRDQVKQLITYLAGQEGLRARRNEAAVLTMLYAGLRCAECAGLRWEDVDMRGRLIAIPISKMGHGRVVVMHRALHGALEIWREHQGHQEGAAQAAVFGDTHDNRLNGESLAPERFGKLCRTISADIGFKFTAHQLRHSFATHTLRQSGNLFAGSKSLGHRKIEQTMRYVSADVEHLRGAVDQLPDLGEW